MTFQLMSGDVNDVHNRTDDNDDEFNDDDIVSMVILR